MATGQYTRKHSLTVMMVIVDCLVECPVQHACLDGHSFCIKGISTLEMCKRKREAVLKA